MGTTREERLERLAAARLYFVCEARPRGKDPRPLLDAALAGGVDVIQLREKNMDDEELVQAAGPFREAAGAHGALFILNDRPDLVAATGADGVHVGQEDVPVAEARRVAGPDVLVGLSTHSKGQVRAACAATGDDRPDQISVGPVWETPTKEGRPATGLEPIRFAAREATLPWFAIGGIKKGTAGEVVAAGARRAVVVRAIRDAADPQEAAQALRAALQKGGEALEPLHEGERPGVVTAGAIICAALAALSLLGYALWDVLRDDPRPPVSGIVVFVALFGVMAWGMWRARYWAVLGFQTVLAIVLVLTAIGMVGATTVLQAVGNVILIAAAGTLFYFMVRAMARIQMPERLPR